MLMAIEFLYLEIKKSQIEVILSSEFESVSEWLVEITKANILYNRLKMWP